MRVLFLSSRLTTRGGAHRWMLSVLARLQGEVQTLAAVGSVAPALPADELARVGPVERVKGLDRSGLSSRGRAGAVTRLERLLERFDPDVVQVNDLVDPDLLRVAAGAGKAVMMVQDHRLFCPGRGKVDAQGVPCGDPMGDACGRCFDDPEYAASLLDLTRRRLEAAAGMARITVLSRYMKSELEQAGVAGQRLRVLPPFVDLPEWIDEDHPAEHHLLAGRLSAHKGVRQALRAAASTGLPLLVAGAGPLEGDVLRAAAGSDGQIRYAGWLGRAELARVLARARSVWLPSIWAEPLGIVGLEALASGVPVVASRVGGVTDWLEHGRSGLLVPPGDAAALAAAARRLEQDEELARRLGRQGQQRVARDFAPETIMARLVGLYRGISSGDEK